METAKTLAALVVVKVVRVKVVRVKVVRVRVVRVKVVRVKVVMAVAAVMRPQSLHSEKLGYLSLVEFLVVLPPSLQAAKRICMKLLAW